MKAHNIVGALITGVLLGGCATVPIPRDRIVNTRAAIRAAEELGARDVPRAALHLQLAQEASEQADILIKKEDMHRAALQLQRSQADAELAVAMCRDATATTEASQASEKLTTFQQHGDR